MTDDELRTDSGDKVTHVAVKGLSEPGNIGGGLLLGFSMLTFSFWANAMGLTDTAGFTVAIGIVLLGFFVIYFVGGLYLLKQGNTFGGCTYVVFASSFGLFAGAVYVTGTVCAAIGLPCDFTLAGIAFLVSGFFLLAVLPGLKYAAKTDFLIYLFAGIGVAAFGFAGIGVAPAAMNPIGGWALFLAAIGSFYAGVAAVLAGAGVDVPCGKPFFKKR